ncbi:uncharacterized protein [Onthophagus taurus]|uniref:uncharacterized protein n=1 Tax=Onthophagus taurus TaxID=166361 RepID=UPI000C2026B7|nr:uncharacterized protein LOC111427114 [Onthophagus taurus]
MFKRVFVIFVLLTIFGAVTSDDNAEEQIKGDRGDFKKFLHKECANSYSTTCLKMDVVSFVDKLDNQNDVSLLPGMSLVRESGARANEDLVAEVAREFPNDPDARLDAFLMNKVSNYLSSHSIKLNLFDSSNAFTARKGDGLGGGGGGGKKGGGMGMLLAAGAMMKGTLMAVAMGALAALAGKALMTALISLMLSAIIGLKSLSGGGHKSTTYEIVAKPVYSHASSASHEEYGGHGHSSYGRSFDVPLPLGLQQGYQP